jgi:membrane protease YdiL (CAAX protease family)
MSWMPVVLTSLLFAAVHAPQMPAPFAIFVLSLALGTLYQRTGSLAAPFTLHALFNGLSTTLALAAIQLQ